MAASNVLVRREGGIHTLFLNRPDKLNALNKDLLEDLERQIDLVQSDSCARALIIAGSGEKAFSVGADLKERQGMNEKDVLVRFELVRQVFGRLDYLPVLTIAAINGIALGGGLELALCCDLRVAQATAVMGFPEVELAIIPGAGGTQRLSRLIGPMKAIECICLAKRLSAVEAHSLGIVSCVADDAVAQAKNLALRILEMGPIAVRQAKLAIKKGLEMPLPEALKFEIECYKPCLYSKDRVEGIKAFSERRKHEYRGE